MFLDLDVDTGEPHAAGLAPTGKCLHDVPLPTTWSRTVSAMIAVSTTPAAPSVCPNCGFELEKGGAEAPNTAPITASSAVSFAGVPVPWPLT
nr:hypothetical protein [Saccharopolyspora sp. ASAGF58]